MQTSTTAAKERRSSSPPRSTDVVVIGGGIAGACTALWLARSGTQVTLCEKGEIGKEQSGRNWGWCRTFGRDRRETALGRLSIRLWHEMNRTINRETGFRQSGILLLARDEASLGKLLALRDEAIEADIDVDLMSSLECKEFTPGATRPWLAGLWSSADGGAEPGLAAPAIAEAAAGSGASLLRQCNVLAIETSAGRVSAVQTSQGRIDCSSVVIAAGAWSTKLCRMIGVRLPQLIVNESVSRTAPVSGAPETTLRTGPYAIRKRLDGGYTIGGGSLIRAELTPDNFRFLRDFLPILRANGAMIRLHPTVHSAAEWLNVFNARQTFRILDPKPDISLTRRVYDALREDFPVFRDIAIEDRWAGSIDVTPDAIPVISPLLVDGAFVITGFSGHGFGMGPGAGRLMAALVSNDPPPVDPAPFHIKRLSTNRPLEIARL